MRVANSSSETNDNQGSTAPSASFSLHYQVSKMVSNIVLPLLVAVSFVACQNNRDWHIGADRVNPSGTAVHGHANIPLHRGNDGRLDANVHGSRVFGGPYNGAQSVGGGLQYQHRGGLHGGVDATNQRGVGTSYSATAGGHTRLGPGTLSVDGGAVRHPGSSRVQGQIGASYNMRF